MKRVIFFVTFFFGGGKDDCLRVVIHLSLKQIFLLEGKKKKQEVSFYHFALMIIIGRLLKLTCQLIFNMCYQHCLFVISAPGYEKFLYCAISTSLYLCLYIHDEHSAFFLQKQPQILIIQYYQKILQLIIIAASLYKKYMEYYLKAIQ